MVGLGEKFVPFMFLLTPQSRTSITNAAKLGSSLVLSLSLSERHQKVSREVKSVLASTQKIIRICIREHQKHNQS